MKYKIGDIVSVDFTGKIIRAEQNYQGKIIYSMDNMRGNIIVNILEENLYKLSSDEMISK